MLHGRDEHGDFLGSRREVAMAALGELLGGYTAYSDCLSPGALVEWTCVFVYSVGTTATRRASSGHMHECAVLFALDFLAVLLETAARLDREHTLPEVTGAAKTLMAWLRSCPGAWLDGEHRTSRGVARHRVWTTVAASVNSALVALSPPQAALGPSVLGWRDLSLIHI